MRKEYLNINTNKLHDELIANGIMPLLVESIDNETWITFQENTDMELVQQIIDAHDPTPLPPPITETERIAIAEQAINDLMMIIMMTGGM